MNKNIIENKSFDFAIKIVDMYKYLTNNKKEFVMSKQLLRCGTSIGANISEGQHGQSKADFATKMNIALKEANETLYWIRLLHRTEYIDEERFLSLQKDITDIKNILIAICKTSFNNNENAKL